MKQTKYVQELLHKIQETYKPAKSQSVKEIVKTSSKPKLHTMFLQTFQKKLDEHLNKTQEVRKSAIVSNRDLVSPNNKKKVRICRQYFKTRLCRFGSECPMAHSLSQLSVPQIYHILKVHTFGIQMSQSFIQASVIISSMKFIYKLTDMKNEMKHPFEVFVRVREAGEVNNESVTLIDECNLQLKIRANDKYYCKSKLMTFKQIFNINHDNNYVYVKTLKDKLQMVSKGYNVTALCYGMTGAGKTYTMFGQEQEGLIQLSINQLFSFASAIEQKVQVTLSFIEIYNETVRDLLSKDMQILQVQENKQGDIILPNITEFILENSDQNKVYITQGQQKRIIASTVRNLQSSRSHAIVIIKYKITALGINGKLTLVDLAGSEKSQYYHQEANQRLQEGQNINRSLLTLGRCIILLKDSHKAHIPYRNSKLTRILKQSFGGNSITILIACISKQQEASEETENTLNYAFAATQIVSKIQINESQHKKRYSSQETPKIDTQNYQSLPQHPQKPLIQPQEMLKNEIMNITLKISKLHRYLHDIYIIINPEQQIDKFEELQILRDIEQEIFQNVQQKRILLQQYNILQQRTFNYADEIFSPKISIQKMSATHRDFRNPFTRQRNKSNQENIA